MATDHKPPAVLTEEQKIERALQTFTYTGANLNDPEWMRVNGDLYAQAVRNGLAKRVGD